MPLRICRWSRQRPPRLGVADGSSGASRSHSSSVISNRLFTASFYRTTCVQPKLNHRSEKQALGRVSRIASGLVGFGAQPDEDVGDGDRGRIPLSELVVSGRHRAELLAAVHQPLDLVTLPIAGPVEGQRSATTSTPAGPVGLLVIALGDGVGDAGPAAAAGPGYPYGVHQSDQLAGVGVLARGEAGRQVAAAAVADRVELGGQPAA